MNSKKPEITVFAGPNGSGKSTITAALPHVTPPYINADDIMRSTLCSNIEAAVMADKLRHDRIESGSSFSFETVLSTPRNLDLLKEAKARGYSIHGFFVLTTSADLNVLRVEARFQNGGHHVPADKVRSRFVKSLANIPEFIDICDICHILDNTGAEPKRIFKKKNNELMYWSTQHWTKRRISRLVNIPLE
jgi:predicted ABC-type ATPase